jgi:hypothetical protein
MKNLLIILSLVLILFSCTKTELKDIDTHLQTSDSIAYAPYSDTTIYYKDGRMFMQRGVSTATVQDTTGKVEFSYSLDNFAYYGIWLDSTASTGILLITTSAPYSTRFIDSIYLDAAFEITGFEVKRNFITGDIKWISDNQDATFSQYDQFIINDGNYLLLYATDTGERLHLTYKN